MQIAEIFYSIQGEGRLVGVPSVFVRTSGCNLRCWFCDTPYTSWKPEGEQRSVDSLVEEITEYGCEHVVLTGGEPMLNADLVPLTERLAASGHHLTIETAGTVDRQVLCDLMSISPKLMNSTPRPDRLPPSMIADRSSGATASTERQDSAPDASLASISDWSRRHDERRDCPDVIRRLICEYDYQFKFVVDHSEDVAEIEQYLGRFPMVGSEHVYLMPQATDAQTLRTKTHWLVEVVKQQGWRLSPRLHVELWGNRRGV